MNQQAQLDSLMDIINSNVGSVDSTKNIISVASSVLNSVNCSATLSCAALNRNACRKTSGECGACLDGYLGDSGDRSTLCIPAHAAVQETSCDLQADCLSWQVCDTGAKLCKAPMKSCSRNCTEHGSCLFVNRVSGAIQKECRLSDVNCDAVCSCEGGFSGVTCELSADTLKSRREIRSSLLSSLLNLTALENANEQSVASWSASLYSLSLNPYEISVNDAARALQIANMTVASAKSLNFDSTAGLVGVLQATDTMFSVQKYNYNPNDYNDPDFSTAREYQNNTAADIIGLVDQFARLVSASLTLGQNASELFYDNFRISSQVSTVGAATTNVSVAAPQSAFEKLAGTKVSSATLSAGNVAASISTNVISVFPRTYTPDTKQFASNPMYLQVAVQDGQPATDVLSSIEFTFPFNEPQKQFLSYSPNITYTCKDTSENFTFVCPDSGEVLSRNCSAGAGQYVTNCPVPAPACAQLDLSSSDITIAGSCKVLSYDATYVTCSCALRSGAGSGRRLGNVDEQSVMDETGVSNMLATATYIGVEFADTFKAADKFNDPSKVIIVIIMFSVLWGAGLMLLTVCFGRSYVSMQKKIKLLSRQVVGAVTSLEGGTTMEDARSRLLNYIENVFPSVYAGDKSSLHRILGELRIHHRYLTLFTLGDGQKSTFGKILVILQTLTMETMQMFLLAVLYDLQCPDDDGSCVSYVTEEDCLARKSVFDSSQTYCQWSLNGATAGSTACTYQEPYFTPTVFIYILILTSVFTAIINTPLDYFYKVCAAPLIEDALDAQVTNSNENKQSLANGLRRLSMQTNQAIQNVGRRGSAMVASTQQFVQKKLWYKNLLLTAKEKAADNIIADRAISEDLREVHKQATTGLSSLVRHSETLQHQHQRQTQRLKQRAESRRSLLQSDLRPEEEPAIDNLRPADSATSTALSSSTLNSAKGKFAEGSAANAVNLVAQRRQLLKLQDEVLCQRLLLPKDSEHLTTYDAQWGIIPVAADLHCLSDEALAAIGADMRTAEMESSDLKERMPYYTLHHGGLAILNLFLLDLLGRTTIAAKIFKNKFEEDFEETRAVSQIYKAFAALLLLGCNAFFIYYTLLKALQKGKTWQYQFLQGCIAQLIVEVFLNETLECIWLNYVVPDLARKEVQRVHTMLNKVVEQLTSGAEKVRTKTILFLDAPSYLFSSTKVAKAHPSLLESLVVLNFHSHLPGELARTWPHYKKYAAEHLKDEMIVDPDADMMGSTGFSLTNNFLFRALLAVAATAMITMRWLGTLSFNIQRIVIRFVQPLVLSGLTLLWMFASSDPIAMYIVIACSSFVILAFLLRQRQLFLKELRDKSAVVPTTAQDDLRDEEAQASEDESSEESSDEDAAGNLHEAPTRHRKAHSRAPHKKKHKHRRHSASGDDSGEDTPSSASNQNRALHGHRHRHRLSPTLDSQSVSSASSKSQPSSVPKHKPRARGPSEDSHDDAPPSPRGHRSPHGARKSQAAPTHRTRPRGASEDNIDGVPPAPRGHLSPYATHKGHAATAGAHRTRPRGPSEDSIDGVPPSPRGGSSSHAARKSMLSAEPSGSSVAKGQLAAKQRIPSGVSTSAGGHSVSSSSASSISKETETGSSVDDFDYLSISVGTPSASDRGSSRAESSIISSARGSVRGKQRSPPAAGPVEIQVHAPRRPQSSALSSIVSRNRSHSEAYDTPSPLGSEQSGEDSAFDSDNAPSPNFSDFSDDHEGHA